MVKKNKRTYIPNKFISVLEILVSIGLIWLKRKMVILIRVKLHITEFTLVSQKGIFTPRNRNLQYY